MHIRIATPEDAPLLLSIYRYYVENTAITFEYDVPTTEEFASRIRNTLLKYPYLVAEENGQLLGYAYASAFKARAAYSHSVETSIYVDHTLRRSGIGSLLLAELEKRLAQQNVLNVNACISSPKGEDPYLTDDSIRFHETRDYKLVGLFHSCGYKFDRWYDMLWMEKMIGEHTVPVGEFIPFPRLS
ncbi:MAG: GNAT family N-acetyltransferase [Lachnospiraceae bacterium]|nr:GNAT family N-acetyltransferase [Lachnospiraceae bacterium]